MMHTPFDRLTTGVSGLDIILHGGLVPRRSYLVRGGPGQGKTTLGLHFLTVGDGPALFISFQESEEQIKANAEVLGLDTSGITFLALAPDETFFTQQQGYDVFSAADVEQEPLAEAIVAAVEKHRPQRVFVDSLTQLRFLSADAFQYRKQVMAFLRFLIERDGTVLFSSETSNELPDNDLQFMADGVLSLAPGTSGATAQVLKFRGSGFMKGLHHMRLGGQGMRVFPRMMPPADAKPAPDEHVRLSSGSKRIDAMLHGGLEAGTITLITGPTGVGKSTLAAQFAAEAARRGRRPAVFLFEEDVEKYLCRARALEIPLDPSLDDGSAILELVEPMRYLGDEFTARVREYVADQSVELVVLDSVAGYELALGGEGVEARVHSFAKTLSALGVTVLLVNETHMVTGQQFQATERGISYLSDNVVFLRYMEHEGELKRTIGVLKKRLSGFDSKIYNYESGRSGLVVGDAVQGLYGVLSGMPTCDETE